MDRATLYAESVVNGTVDSKVCELHRKACERHLKDLEKQGTPDFPFVWNEEKANDILNFAETLTIAEGYKPKQLQLYPCQCFDLAVPNGWINKETGYRRFRRGYESMGRQNGKTFKNGIRGTYYSGFSGYSYGKLFTVATKKRQARLAWEEMSKFINIDKDLAELYKVMDYKSVIKALHTNCTIEALSKESGLDDGFRSIYNSIDEIHQHRDNSIYKALYNGTRSLPETYNSMITTRGKDLNSFCYEMDEYCQSILQGTSTADDFFVDIYTIDKHDDFFDESIWIKANPILMRNPHSIEIMRQDARTAQDMGGSELVDFAVKCLNVWYQDRDNSFVDIEAFKECGCDLTLESFRGHHCVAGLDLSSGGDLTTLSLHFDMPNGEWFTHSHSFMPRGVLNDHIKTDVAPYDLWEKMGLITVTGSDGDYKNDYMYIVSYLRQTLNEYDLKIDGISADPHNIDGILTELEGFGCPVNLLTQSHRQLNDATCDFRLSVKSHTMHYNKYDELFMWSVKNAIIVDNSYGEIKIDKQAHARYRRIDPVDACIDARAYVIAGRKSGIDVQTELDNYLKQMGWI